MLMLASGGFGYSGVTPAFYASLPDQFLMDLLFGPRGEDGAVIPERELRAEGGRRRTAKEQAKDLPSAESLEIPPEAFLFADHAGRGVPTSFVLMWWQAWRARPGKTTEELMAAWTEYLEDYGQRPVGGR